MRRKFVCCTRTASRPPTVAEGGGSWVMPPAPAKDPRHGAEDGVPLARGALAGKRRPLAVASEDRAATPAGAAPANDQCRCRCRGGGLLRRSHPLVPAADGALATSEPTGGPLGHHPAPPAPPRWGGRRAPARSADRRRPPPPPRPRRRPCPLARQAPGGRSAPAALGGARAPWPTQPGGWRRRRRHPTGGRGGPRWAQPPALQPSPRRRRLAAAAAAGGRWPRTGSP